MKYRYHIVIWFESISEELRTRVDSDNEVLKLSEIRDHLTLNGHSKKGGFNILNVSKTIND